MIGQTTDQIRDQDRHMCAAQAARMVDAVREFYADTDETDPATLLTYAFCDLRHVAAAELVTSFAVCNRSGLNLCLQELQGAGSRKPHSTTKRNCRVPKRDAATTQRSKLLLPKEHRNGNDA